MAYTMEQLQAALANLKGEPVSSEMPVAPEVASAPLSSLGEQVGLQGYQAAQSAADATAQQALADQFPPPPSSPAIPMPAPAVPPGMLPAVQGPTSLAPVSNVSTDLATLPNTSTALAPQAADAIGPIGEDAAYAAAQPVTAEVAGGAADAIGGLPAKAAGLLGESGGAFDLGALGGAAADVAGPAGVAYALLHGSSTAPKELDEMPQKPEIFSMKPGQGASGLNEMLTGDDLMPSGSFVKAPAGSVENEEEEGAPFVPGAPQATADVAAAGKAGTKDYISDMLAKIYGPDLGDDALKAAQEQRGKTELIANLSKAANQIGASLSRGTIKPQNEVADSILKDAGQPVQDILTRRAAKMQELETGVKASDFADKEQLRDATSPISASYRAMALDINPSLSKQPDFANMSAEGVKALLPGIDAKAKMQFYKDAHETAAATKLSASQAKAQSDVANTIQRAKTSGRGAAGQAEVTDLSVEKIKELTNEVLNRPENRGKSVEQALNNMSTTDMNAYKKEYARILQGGIAGEKEGSTLFPNTAHAALNTLYGQATGIVQPARMGSFVAQQMPYMEGLQKTSRDYVRNNIIEPQIKMNMGRLGSPDKADEIRKIYPQYYPQLQQAPGAPQAPKAIAAPSAPDPEAEEYVNTHIGQFPGLTVGKARQLLDARSRK